MSVKSLETACEVALFSGFSKEDIFGYDGPKTFSGGVPSAANFCLSARNLSRIASSGHVAGHLVYQRNLLLPGMVASLPDIFLTGVKYMGELWPK